MDSRRWPQTSSTPTDEERTAVPRALPRVPARAVPALVVAAVATALTAVPSTPAAAAPPPAAAAPTAQELAAEQAEAERLDAETRAQAQTIAAARARLDELAAQAGEAMERYQQALRDVDAAEAERAVQEERLGVARDVLAGNRADMGRWASETYRDGGAMARYEELMTLLESESTDDLSQRLAMLETVGRVRGSAVETARDAETVQRDATARSRAAAIEAAEAARRAEAAKQDADGLLAAQRAQLNTLDALLAATQEDAEVAEARAAQMALVRAAAEQRRLAAAAASGRRGANAVTGPVGDCAGGDVQLYGNGTIPASALCPLVSAPDHRLRADAAFAFDQLAGAYQAAFGRELCLTDSYRSVDTQVRLFATKPNLAAVPGTSNHGWGTAVDLCGGIESFGTPQHQWMRNNASLYGWFHPTWAQADGSRPEPWHWEFGG